MRGRQVPAENMHVTLAFIGAWPVARLPTLLDAMATVHGEPMNIALDKLGAFRRAGIAWVGPSLVPDASTRLAASLVDALSAACPTLDAQPLPARDGRASLTRSLSYGTGGPFSFDGDRVSLMQSEPCAEGARYQQLATWPLR